mgnify:CR=1 FL=1
MLNFFIQRTTAALALVACLTSAMGQDLIARQAPVDKKMRAVDSVEIQRLFEQENLANPGEDLYPSWEDKYINMYGNVPLPSEFKIDLRNFCMPTANRIVTSRYGYRPRFRRQHKGLDINAYKGDTIRAAFDGKVRVVTFQKGGYGNVVVIRHPNGLETVYGHLSKHLTKPDKTVKAGEPIGLAGSTGRSTGTHLHFETRLCGVALNPALMFDFRNQDVTGNYYMFRANRYEREGIAVNSTTGRKQDSYSVADVRSTQSPAAIRRQQAQLAQQQQQAKKEEQKNKKNAKESKKDARYHKVSKGETLYSIARSRGLSVEELCKINHIGKSMRIRPGQILRFS